MAKKEAPTKPAWPFATISKEPSAFADNHEFNGVNRNKSIQSMKRRDNGGINEPFAANKGLLAPRPFTTYSLAEPAKPFPQSKEKTDDGS
jgi:hypothetical protein